MSKPENGSVLDRVRGLAREIARFGAVGGLGVLVNLGVFNLIRQVTDLQVVRASVIATLVAIVTNYLGFRYFAYRDRADRTGAGRTRELGLFVAFSAIGLVIENGILFTATYGFHWDGPLASNFFKFTGIGIATVFRFWSYRTWVFKALPAPPAASLVVEQRDGQAPAAHAAPADAQSTAARTPETAAN
ncbi:GtrA family protein [Streptomyces sp. NBC_00193]|uniref:GtrA family protein n=1 Tax=Streptomyces sp. NBC_00193 TaxID=2975675 RepID=UPI002253D0A7|nr:GtrA family protein [Streptomyces sp. NBC_00193]MCX5298055.1 GtrA family protein [Streptomyces sp. NBC_00193]